MKRLLGTLLALLLLAAGCGDDTGDGTGDDTSAENTASTGNGPEPVGGGAVDFTEVALLSATNAGGEVSTEPTALDSKAAVSEFAASLEGRTLPAEIRAAAAEADVTDARALVGSVVAIGCDVPPGVGVHRTAAGLEVTALKVKEPHKECFAPVTTVVLLLVDADAMRR